MDSVKKFLDAFKNEEKYRHAAFSNKLLNEIGDIYGRYGIETAKLYLSGKGGEEEIILIDILDQIDSYKITGEVAIFIIKKLNTIKEIKEN